MNLFEGPEDLVLPNVTPLRPPAFRVLDKIADRQPRKGLNRGKHSAHTAPPPDFQVQPFLAVGRRDFLLVDLVLRDLPLIHAVLCLRSLVCAPAIYARWQ